MVEFEGEAVSEGSEDEVVFKFEEVISAGPEDEVVNDGLRYKYAAV